MNYFVLVQKTDYDDIMPDYQSECLKLTRVSNEEIDEVAGQFEPVEETNEVKRICELEQTRKILVGLTEVLFKKVEEMTPN